ncbi:MAG: diacylglycerol kinase, partial [Bacteroidetes bacterium]
MNEKFIDKYLDTDKYEYEVLFTEKEGHATEICAKAIEDGFNIIIAVGGDGTLNEVAKKVVDTDILFGIIPAGSGNGFARHLGIPLSLKGALGVINKQKVQRIDTINIYPGGSEQNDENRSFYMSTAGMGFDAEMAYQFKTAKTRGLWIYVKLVVQHFFTYTPKEYEIHLGEEKIVVEAFAITVANASQFGNNATISPNAKLDDGLLDVCISRKFPLYALPMLVYRFFTGTIDKSGYIKVHLAEQVRVKMDS